MPEINKITEVLHDGNQPYHVHYDNLPLKNILTRIDLVNAQVDINSDILRGCSGSVGSLSNRLDVSINDNGKLKSSEVDNSLHNIAYHEDGEKTINNDEIDYFDGLGYSITNPASFVRMIKEERNKLALIESEANKLYFEIQDSLTETDVEISSGSVRFEPTSSIIFEVEAPNIVKIHSAFPADAAHRHHYNLTPEHTIPSGPDYQNYKTTALNTPFLEGTLRVYVNGFRIGVDSIKVPDADGSNWTVTYISSQDETDGSFSLNRALSEDDVIKIDFDEIFE